jgi:hypothetical protein
MSDQMLKHLEEQLRDAHAANAELRERVVAADDKSRTADSVFAEGIIYKRQLEKAHAKQKAAEDNAAAAQRKQVAAERDLRHANDEIEKLEGKLERAQTDADKLRGLNARIESASHAGDLFS